MHSDDLTRRLGAEFLGTTFLLATIAGSGIIGEALATGPAGTALLPHSLAIGVILFVFSTVFNPACAAIIRPKVRIYLGHQHER
jgi:glycerol uptake facilitator-like aquaporin